MVVPVFTAHPSEARRRTILEKLDQIANQLDRLEQMRLLPYEQAEALATIATEIESFWLTDTVRDRRPHVVDEIRHGLGMVSDTLFEIVPKVYRGLGRGAGADLPGSWRARAAAAAVWRRGSAATATAILTSRTTSRARRFACIRKLILRHYLRRGRRAGPPA